MKIIVKQENLSKALNTVSRIASSKVSLPILNNIFIKAEKGKILLSATNMDIAISQSIGADVKKEGVVVVPAKLITEFVANLPKTNINLELHNKKLNIESGNYKSTINTIDPEDFPEIPEIKEANKLIIKTELFKKSVTQTAPVCSVDVTRPILTGVYIYNLDNEIYFVATDGYRLAEKKVMKSKEKIQIIVPANSLLNVNQSIDDNLENIEILFNDEQISFNLGNIEITSKLINGKYIDYRGLIPIETENKAIIDKTEFLRVVKIAELFARENSGSVIVKNDSKKSIIDVRSIASEFGDNNAIIEAETVGDGDIVLNAKFLIEALNNINTDKISFCFNGKLMPSLITGDKDDYRHIIMPVKS